MQESSITSVSGSVNTELLFGKLTRKDLIKYYKMLLYSSAVVVFLMELYPNE